MTDATPVDVRLVAVEVVRPLRHRVLRGPDRPLAESVYPQDELRATVHVAAYLDDGVVGCATFFPEPFDGQPAWRLRGMATEPSVRRRGVGSALLTEGLRIVESAGVRLLWCNARTGALPFYRRHGFQTVGAEFLTATGIPHYVAVVSFPTKSTST